MELLVVFQFNPTIKVFAAPVYSFGYFHAGGNKSLIYIVGMENQKRLTALIPGMGRLNYGEVLDRLSFYLMEIKRVRGDPIETCAFSFPFLFPDHILDACIYYFKPICLQDHYERTMFSL